MVTVTSRDSWSNNCALPVTLANSLQQCHRQCLLAALSAATTETVGLTGDGNDSSCERTICIGNRNNFPTLQQWQNRGILLSPKNDFKKFTLIDLYANKNFHSHPAGGKVTLIWYNKRNSSIHNASTKQLVSASAIKHSVSYSTLGTKSYNMAVRFNATSFFHVLTLFWDFSKRLSNITKVSRQ